jgi:hypothetical protein
VIVGQHAVLEELLVAIFARGHCTARRSQRGVAGINEGHRFPWRSRSIELDFPYSTANDSVDLTLIGKQTFATGGQLTIVCGPSGGVTGASGAPLGGTTVLAISAEGRMITPAMP